MEVSGDLGRLTPLQYDDLMENTYSHIFKYCTCQRVSNGSDVHMKGNTVYLGTFTLVFPSGDCYIYFVITYVALFFNIKGMLDKAIIKHINK